MRRKSKFTQWLKKKKSKQQDKKSLSFFLDWDTEHELIKTAAKLTDERLFSEFARKALQVIPALMRRDVTPLFEVFPWVKDVIHSMALNMIEEKLDSLTVNATVEYPERNYAQPINDNQNLSEMIGKLLSEVQQPQSNQFMRLEHKIDDLAFTLGSSQVPTLAPRQQTELESGLLELEANSEESTLAAENYLASMALFD